jgi:hypothetical protein
LTLLTLSLSLFVVSFERDPSDYERALCQGMAIASSAHYWEPPFLDAQAIDEISKVEIVDSFRPDLIVIVPIRGHGDVESKFAERS